MTRSPRPARTAPARVGVIGTGFIGTGLFFSLERRPDLHYQAGLTRRDPGSVPEIDAGRLTDSAQRLIDECDVIVECSGDTVYATPLIRRALEAGVPVVTMNSELQVTAGSYLQRFGYLTEAEGDQPGSIAALRRDVVAMGFEPLVYGNVKGFLNRTPTRPEMEKLAALQGISVEQVTSFTDGTKVHIEQVVVANGLDADLAPGGMVGGDTVYDGFQEGACALAAIAERAGIVMSDFLMASTTPSPGRNRPRPGVFVVATMPDPRQRPSLKYYKLGEGPYYVFERPFHLCHFELPKTVRAAVDGDAPLLNNGASPRYGVAAVAKRDLAAGETIARGVGGFEVRGEGVAIAEDPEHAPVALLGGARLRRGVRAGERLRLDDLEIPESEALEAWLGTVARRTSGSAPEPRTIGAA
jgi:predicted homoserine dehydrogenase-like protein